MSYPTKLTSTIAVFLAMPLVGTITITSSIQKAYAIGSQSTGAGVKQAAPMAISGDNVYITWWINKTGNNEVMFRASTDGGKTFGDKINLSNSIINSERAEIGASEKNVFVTWWETMNGKDVPMLRVSTDNGKTFGQTVQSF